MFCRRRDDNSLSSQSGGQPWPAGCSASKGRLQGGWYLGVPPQWPVGGDWGTKEMTIRIQTLVQSFHAVTLPPFAGHHRVPVPSRVEALNLDPDRSGS